MDKLFHEINLRNTLQRSTTYTFIGEIEVESKKHLLFTSSIGYHIRARRLDATYLEEDGTYVPLYCLKEDIRVHCSRILTGPTIVTPQRSKGENSKLWETRDASNRICYTSLNPLTNRPDTPTVPRSRKLADAFSWYLPRGFRILNMPLLVGEMDMVLTMPLTMSPKFGARRELARLIPGLLQHLKRTPLKLGQVVEVHLSSSVNARRIYLIVDRQSDRDLGDIQAWVMGMMLVLEQAEVAELKQLTVLRPPDHFLLTGWHEVATLIDNLRNDPMIPEIILAPGTFSTDLRYLNQDPVLLTQSQQPGIRLPRLERPLPFKTSIFNIALDFPDNLPRYVTNSRMIKTLYRKNPPHGTVIKFCPKSCLVLYCSDVLSCA